MLRILEKNHVGSETQRKVGSGPKSKKIIPDPQHWLELCSSSNSMRTAVYFFLYFSEEKIRIFHMNVMQTPTLNVRFTLCCRV
jgi:hypothetical protein